MPTAISHAATNAPPPKRSTSSATTSRSSWQTASSRRAAAESVAYLQNVDADGLDPSDYPAPTFKAGDLDALAEAELRLTGEILEYARHASIGRVHFSRISNDIGFEQDAPEPAEILRESGGRSRCQTGARIPTSRSTRNTKS